METAIQTLTPKQVAKALQLTERTVYDHLRAGRLPGRRIGGGRWRVLEEDLKAFVRGETAADRDPQGAGE